MALGNINLGNIEWLKVDTITSQYGMAEKTININKDYKLLFIATMAYDEYGHEILEILIKPEKVSGKLLISKDAEVDYSGLLSARIYKNIKKGDIFKITARYQGWIMIFGLY